VGVQSERRIPRTAPDARDGQERYAAAGERWSSCGDTASNIEVTHYRDRLSSLFTLIGGVLLLIVDEMLGQGTWRSIAQTTRSG
jgi:hypothetical protein